MAAAERTLATLPPGAHEAARARLLATIALESRGTRSERGPQAARQAEEIARRLDDPALLAFALNGVFMQTFDRAGLAPRRDEIGAELVALSARHGLVTFEVLGHLVRIQARSALADFTGADRHAAAAELLAERHELPLVGVFTGWYRALRLAATGRAPLPEVEAAYRDAAASLHGAGMPGLRARPAAARAAVPARATRAAPPPPTITSIGALTSRGPAPWSCSRRTVPPTPPRRCAPPPSRPATCCSRPCGASAARAAIAVGDRETMRRAHAELAPAAGSWPERAAVCSPWAPSPGTSTTSPVDVALTSAANARAPFANRRRSVRPPSLSKCGIRPPKRETRAPGPNPPASPPFRQGESPVPSSASPAFRQGESAFAP